MAGWTQKTWAETNRGKGWVKRSGTESGFNLAGLFSKGLFLFIGYLFLTNVIIFSKSAMILAGIGFMIWWLIR